VEEVDWSSLHKILSDTTRRSILELMAEKEALSYTEIMALLQVTNTGRLNYHLKALHALISKDDQGKYHLTERGKLAVNLLQTFPERTAVDSKKHQSGLRTVVVVGLLLVGILLISFAVGLFALTNFTVISTGSASVYSQVIPQNTTVSLLITDVQNSNIPLKISWSASSHIIIYVMNTTQHDALVLEHTINGQVQNGLMNFTGVPSSWVSRYDAQTGSLSLSLSQGQYYFLASSSTQIFLNSFTLTQQQPQQATGSSLQPTAGYLLALVPLTLGVVLLVLAILILTRRVWR
jgi:hypothetical protein